MSKYNLVADVSAYQLHQVEFFRRLKRNGIRAVIIKLTQATSPRPDDRRSNDVRSLNPSDSGLTIRRNI